MSRFRPEPWQVHAAGAAVIVVLTVLAAGTILLPLVEARAEHVALRSRLDTERGKADVAQRTERRLADRLVGFQEELAAGELELKPVHHLNRRLAAITEVIESAGMMIRETKLGEVQSGAWYQRVPIRLSGTGSFTRTAEFMHRLHRDIRDVGIVAFDLSGNPGNPGARSSYHFDLVWYAAPEAVATGE